MNMSEILFIPEVLRQKLGDDGARELAALINQAAKRLRENIGETASERLERRLAETKGDLEKHIANVKADLTKWMFVFWVGQIAVITGLLSLFYNLLR